MVPQESGVLAIQLPRKRFLVKTYLCGPHRFGVVRSGGL